MNLSHTCWCNWHDDLSKEISVVIGGESGSVYPVANEGVVEITLTLVHVDLVVIAKRELGEVAVKIEHNIAIDINEEIALALL
jgi:hypothetical protein